MLKTIAIDDEPLALEVVKSHASKVDFLDLKITFMDPFKVIDRKTVPGSPLKRFCRQSSIKIKFPVNKNHLIFFKFQKNI